MLIHLFMALGWAAEMSRSFNSARLLLDGDSVDLLKNSLSNLSLQEQDPREWLGVKVNVKSPNWMRFTEIVKETEAGKRLQSGDFGGNVKQIDKLIMLTVMAHCQLIQWADLIPTLKELTLDEVSISADDLTAVEVKELDLLWLGKNRFPTSMPVAWLKTVLPKMNLTYPLILRLLPLMARTSKRFDTGYGAQLLRVISSLCMMVAGKVLKESSVLKLVETMPVGQHWDHLLTTTSQMVRIGKTVPIDGYVLRVMPDQFNASPRFCSHLSSGWQGPQQARWQDFQGLSLLQVRALVSEEQSPPIDRAMSAEPTVPSLEEVYGLPISLKGAIRLGWWMEMVMRDADLSYYLQANLNIMLHSIARLSQLKSQKERDGLAEPSLPWLLVFKNTLPDILETCYQRHVQLASKKVSQLHHDLRSRLVHLVEVERGILDKDYDVKQVHEYFGPPPPFPLHPCYTPLSLNSSAKKKRLPKKEKPPSPPLLTKSDHIRRSASGEQLQASNKEVGALRRRKLSDQTDPRTQSQSVGRVKLSQSTPQDSSPQLQPKHARSHSSMAYFSVPVPRHNNNSSSKGEDRKNLLSDY